MSGIVAYVPDLMDRSRVAAAAAVRFVPSPGDLVAAATGADLVVVDLSRPGVLDVLHQIAAPTVGFTSHVDRAAMDAARLAGCDRVLARSAFFGHLGEIIGAGGRD